MGALAEGRAVAQPPGAQVHPGVQAKIGVLLALAAAVVEAVIEERGRDAVVALRRCHIAAGVARLCRLRHVQQQLQVAGVEFDGGTFDQIRKRDTAFIVGAQRVQIGRLQRQTAHQTGRQARGCPKRRRRRHEGDIALVQELAVDDDIQRIHARLHRVAMRIALHVDGLATDQEAFAELQRRHVIGSRLAGDGHRHGQGNGQPQRATGGALRYAEMNGALNHGGGHSMRPKPTSLVFEEAAS